MMYPAENDSKIEFFFFFFLLYNVCPMLLLTDKLLFCFVLAVCEEGVCV